MRTWILVSLLLVLILRISTSFRRTVPTFSPSNSISKCRLQSKFEPYQLPAKTHTFQEDVSALEAFLNCIYTRIGLISNQGERLPVIMDKVMAFMVSFIFRLIIGNFNFFDPVSVHIKASSNINAFLGWWEEFEMKCGKAGFIIPISHFMRGGKSLM